MLIKKIYISKANGYLPTDYVETYNNEVILLPEKPIINKETTSWDGVKDINVYAEYWDTYKAQVIVKESTYVGLSVLQLADDITIELENGDTHKAFIVEYNDATRIDGRFLLLEFEYKNLDSKKIIRYQQNIIVNYTEISLYNVNHDSTFKDIPNTNWSDLSSLNVFYKLKSNLAPIIDVSKPKILIDKDTGKDVVGITTESDTIKYRGYFTKEESTNLLRFLPLVSQILVIDRNINPIEIYSLKENVTPKIKEIGNDVYIVEFEGKINDIVYKHDTDLRTKISLNNGGKAITDTNWSSLTIPYILYSNFAPIKNVSNPEQFEDNQTGTKFVNQTFVQDIIEIKGYFTRDEKNNLHRFLPLVSDIQITDERIPITYTLTEITTPISKVVADGIYEVKFTGVINNIVYEHY